MNVAGPDSAVRSILADQGPHDADFRTQDVKVVAEADLLVINGLSLDDNLAKKIQRAAGNGRVKLLDLGSKLPKTALRKGCEHDHSEEEEEDGHHHHHGPNDPHAWLGLDTAPLMVRALAAELAAVDATRAAEYQERGEAYANRITALRTESVAKLEGKKERRIVTFHESLGYFAPSLGLEVAGVIQTTPGQDPTAKQLSKLIAFCVKEKVRVIAVEPQFSTLGAAERLKQELRAKGLADAELVPVDTLETVSGELTPQWYEDRMRANIEALVKVLR
jgi:ABC-type Zn uptake system ZnuABC Zn-binding protein ZnuA